MSGDLDEVFRRVRVRPGKERDEGLVDRDQAVIEYLGVPRAGWLQGLAEDDEMHRNLCSLRTADADDADTASARRRGESDDGLKMHAQV